METKPFQGWDAVVCSGLNPVGYLGSIGEVRFLLGCVGFRAAGATLGLHLWLPKTQQHLQGRIFFSPSFSLENRKCLFPWGCLCSRTINVGLHSLLLQLHVLITKNVHFGFSSLAPREQVSSFRICTGSGCPQLMWFHRDLRAFHSVGFFSPL